MLSFDRDILTIDQAATLADLEAFVAEQTYRHLRREGAVVGLSGGVDSAVTAAVCARAGR